MTSSSTDMRETRKFGVVAFLFFGALCVVALWREKVFMAGLFGTLSALGLGFMLFPGPLRPVHDLWLKVAHFIGRVFTALVLALAYYLVITPFGLAKKLFGGAPLPTGPDPSASTYWVSRLEPAQPKERFTKRY